MKSKIIIFIASIMLTIFSANAQKSFNFSGKIGSYGVKGDISLFNVGNASLGTIIGSYGYNKSSGKLSLKGTWYSRGNNFQLIMTEVDNKGQECGYWDVTYNPSQGSVSGTMRNKKGKSFSVKLKRR